MPKSGSGFAAKDRVYHAVFGMGTIVEVNQRHTVVAFDEHGTRKFMTDLVQLAASDSPPPAKPVRKKKAKPA